MLILKHMSSRIQAEKCIEQMTEDRQVPKRAQSENKPYD